MDGSFPPNEVVGMKSNDRLALIRYVQNRLHRLFYPIRSQLIEELNDRRD